MVGKHSETLVLRGITFYHDEIIPKAYRVVWSDVYSKKKGKLVCELAGPDVNRCCAANMKRKMYDEDVNLDEKSLFICPQCATPFAAYKHRHFLQIGSTDWKQWDIEAIIGHKPAESYFLDSTLNNLK